MWFVFDVPRASRDDLLTTLALVVYGERWIDKEAGSVSKDTLEHSEATCPFCLPDQGDVIVADEHCYAVWTGEAPEGSAMVLPFAHRETPFEMTEAEWLSTRSLLNDVLATVDRQRHPDGWNVGWNVMPVGGQAVPHAHCHLVPRYKDELYAGRGFRWWFKQPENVRASSE